MSSSLAFAVSLFRRFLPALLALAATLPLSPARAADGDLDPTFVTDLPPAETFSPQVYGILSQPDGKILPLGGYYTRAGGSTVIGAMRMLVDGATDPGFSALTPPSAPTRFCGIVQADGKILIGGTGDSASSVSPFARLNADGSLDATYVPAAITRSASQFSTVTSMVLQPDGKVIIIGQFDEVSGHAHTRIARLNADGSEDTSFNPVFTNGASSPGISALTLQADGKILVGGFFTSVNGVPRSNFTRLNEDGSLDDLNLITNNTVVSILVQADGDILVGGGFTTVSLGTVVGASYPKLCRVKAATGTLDEAFSVNLPNINSVFAMSQQIDGKIFVVGSGPSGAPVPCHRLNLNGSLDGSFTPDAALKNLTDSVFTVSQQFDGAVLLGRFPDTATGPGLNRTGLVRMKNGPGNQYLTVEAARVQWLRSGPLPEVTEATFQLSTDGGANWSTLGAGTRIAGGWELTGLSLPESGIVRVVSRPVRGGRTASISLLGYQQPFHLTGSQIAVEQPANRTVEPGGSRDFGRCAVGQSVNVTFIVRNFASVDLAGLGFSISGADASSFAVTASPDAPVSGPDGSATFTVRFRPSSLGPKTALLSIANNTPGGSPFQINLTGAAQADGSPNPIYAAPSIAPGTNEKVSSVAVQADGKTVIGGEFPAVDGFPRTNIARFNADGSLDRAFDPGAAPVFAIGALTDGKVLVSDSNPARVRRLNADGTADNGFTPPTQTSSSAYFTLSEQADGRLLLGGVFSIGGRTDVLRLNTNGSIDESFTDPGVSVQVDSLEAVEDGKIVVQGSGTVLRLNSDGTPDPTFMVPPVFGSPFCMVVQKDGRIIVGGRFNTISGQTRSRLARFLADGTLDPSFDPAPDSDVYALALQADGRILVGGQFAHIGGMPRARLARLNPDGSVDSSFVADVTGSLVYAIALTSTGQIVVGGDLQTINGTAVPAVTQLFNTVGTSTLAATRANRVEWLRGGSVGETHWTRFELSTDGGSTWTPLGQGTRISGGWELTGLSLPASGLLRASAVTKTGGGSIFGGGAFSAVNEVASFTLDVTPPTLTAPGNGFTPLRVFAGTTLADYASQATATDANPVTKTQTPPAGTALAVGITHVTVTATDEGGNTATLEFDVDVRPTAPVNTLRLVSGAAAPGRLTSADLPDDAVIASFGPPATSDAGDVAFVAKWTSATGPVKRGTALFLNDECLAVAGGNASAIVAGAKWKSFTDPVIDAGKVAFIAKLSTGASAVVMGNASGLAKVAASGDDAPDTIGGMSGQAKFKSFKAVAIEGEAVAFLGQRAIGTGTPKVTAATDDGVWAKNDTIALKRVLGEGAGLDNRTIQTLTAFAGGNGSPGMGRGWLVVNDSGPQVLVRVVFTSGQQAVLVADVDGGGVTTLTQTKNGGTGVAGADFASYSIPARNAARDTAFLASLGLKTGVVTKADAQAIFASLPVTPALPENGATEPDAYAPLARLGRDAGTTGGKFSVLKDPVLAGDGALAFPATIKGTGIKGTAAQTLWWRPAGGALTLLAQGGGTNGAPTDLPAGSQWQTFTSLALAADRGPLFTGSLVPGKGDASKATANGAWAMDFTGKLRTLFRVGDKIPLDSDPQHDKTLKSFTLLKASVGSAGVTRSFNDAAQIVWLATFTDKSQAIVTTEVP